MYGKNKFGLFPTNFAVYKSETAQTYRLFEGFYFVIISTAVSRNPSELAVNFIIPACSPA